MIVTLLPLLLHHPRRKTSLYSLCNWWPTYHASDTLIWPDAISVYEKLNQFIYLVGNIRLGRLRVSSAKASSHGVSNGVSYRRTHRHSSGCRRHLGKHTRLPGCCGWSTHSRWRGLHWNWGMWGRRCSPGHRWWWWWCPTVKKND